MKLLHFEKIINRSPFLGACNFRAPATPIISYWNGIFTDQSVFRYCSRQIGHLQSTWAHFCADKTMQPHVNMSTSFRHSDLSLCLWLQLVTEVPVGIWIQTKNRSVYENTVTAIWDGCRLLVMGSCHKSRQTAFFCAKARQRWGKGQLSRYVEIF